MEIILLAVVLGGAFGFALDRVGATNPGYIIRMLNLTNLHLAKTILMGIGVAAILLFSSLLAGLVDPGHLSVKAAHIGVFFGGILLGLGFAISGYCPGTGLAAMATGRIDALIFVLGGLTGAAAYMGTHETVAGTGLLEGIAGGKATLGPIAGTEFPGLFGIPGEWIGLAMGVIFIAVAAAVPARIRG
jgi:uncharacterized protein